MSHITVRRFEERDRVGFGHVRSMTYRGGQPVVETEDLLGGSRRGYVAEREGEIVGTLTVLDMDCTRDGSAVSNAGVCAVAVLPHIRRSGIGSSLMRESVRLFHEDGYIVTSLYAYREPFYRQFGYEVCGKLNTIYCPTHRLPKVNPEIPARQLTGVEIGQLLPCFRSFAARYSGMNTRQEDIWWPQNGSEQPYVVYVCGDPIEAYMILRIQSDFWVDQEVRELVWTTHRGYEAMLDVMAGLCINKNGVRWPEPGGSPLISRFLDQGVEITERRPISYRILDLPKSLATLKTRESGSFVLSVKDEIIESNSGSWRIEFGPQGVQTEKTTSEADVEFDIRTLTQAWLGEPSFDDLANDGLVRIANPTKLNAIRALFRPCRVYCAETF